MRATTRVAATKVTRLPIVPVAILAVLVLAAVFSDFLAPHNPDDISLRNKGLPPFWATGGNANYLLGTDMLGRDVLSRLIFGARITLIVVAVGLLLAGIIGTTLGLISGYFGGWVDAVIMRAVDSTLSLPVLLVALLLTAVLGASLNNLLYVFAIVLWARYARVVRGEVLSIKEREFVAYAHVAGTPAYKVLLNHIFPNVFNTLMVLITFQAGAIILFETALSFLGAGVPPPTPSWGSMVSEGRSYIVSAWWLAFFPGLAIGLVVLCFNLLGDWLRDFLDPKLRQV
ncbi:MAG: ABC transporter permease [Chloroflexi bacterium]|nr:ABC transporter permease [Chloroflexota bacterium]